MHDHITKEVERIGQRHRPGAHPVFAATLKDGTFLPCVRAFPHEHSVYRVRPEAKEPHLQFDAKALGSIAHVHCIIHGDNVKSVEPSPYFIPQNIFDKLIATEYRGEFFALRLRMRDDKEFTLQGGLGMSCYKLPESYSWNDVEEFGSSYDHDSINSIFPMIEFYCILWGLSFAKIRDAEGF